LYLGHIVEEGVEARAADDTDLCVRHDKHSSGLRRPASENVEAPASTPGALLPKTPGTPSPYDDGVPGRKFYAAELLLDEPLPDDFESDEDDELVDEDDVEEVDGLEAGELLDEEPRLSLR
jgi:hypothetical protein